MITHGNGPQVGLLALEADAYKAVAPYPLDILGAESQGMIGYLLAPGARRRAARTRGRCAADAGAGRPRRPRLHVPDEADRPGVLGEGVARRLAADRGWTVARDGKYFRRVVASPEPQGIVELQAIERLVAAGSLVICAGGGGIPVVARLRRAARRRGGDRQGPDGGTARRGARRREADRAHGRAVRRARLGHGCGDADRGGDARRASRALVCRRLDGRRRSRPPAASSSARAAKPSSAR